jgi:hypothetical protein
MIQKQSISSSSERRQIQKGAYKEDDEQRCHFQATQRNHEQKFFNDIRRNLINLVFENQ